MALPLDQAASLRAIRPARPEGVVLDPPQPALIAIASGKGGVGKTFVSVNLGLSLQARSRHCLVIDMNWGLANVDVALGLAPVNHLGHVLGGECSLEEAVARYEGMPILANACGEDVGGRVTREAVRSLCGSVRREMPEIDVVIADTHPGIASQTMDVLSMSHIIVAVTTPEPTSVTDTYALLKVLAEHGACERAGVVVNQASSVQQAVETARHLDLVTSRFLGKSVPFWGHILQDPSVSRAVRDQRAVVGPNGRSLAARCVAEIASRVDGLLAFDGVNGTPRSLFVSAGNERH